MISNRISYALSRKWLFLKIVLLVFLVSNFLSFLDASFGNLDVNSRVVKCDVGTSHEFRGRRDHRWMLFTLSFAM